MTGSTSQEEMTVIRHQDMRGFLLQEMHSLGRVVQDLELMEFSSIYEKSIQRRGSDQLVTYFLRFFIDCEQRIAVVHRKISCLQKIDVQRDTGIELNADDAWSVAFDVCPDVKIAAIDINREEIQVLRDSCFKLVQVKVQVCVSVEADKIKLREHGLMLFVELLQGSIPLFCRFKQDAGPAVIF